MTSVNRLAEGMRRRDRVAGRRTKELNAMRRMAEQHDRREAARLAAAPVLKDNAPSTPIAETATASPKKDNSDAHR